MIYVGIDVAKDKHDCFITNSDGEMLFKVFTITNNLYGFNDLYQRIESVMEDITPIFLKLMFLASRVRYPRMIRSLKYFTFRPTKAKRHNTSKYIHRYFLFSSMVSCTVSKPITVKKHNKRTIVKSTIALTSVLDNN